jgi:hypothetical protein
MDRIGREKFDKNTMTESVPNKPDRRRQRSQILGSSNQSGGNKNSGGDVHVSAAFRVARLPK